MTCCAIALTTMRHRILVVDVSRTILLVQSMNAALVIAIRPQDSAYRRTGAVVAVKTAVICKRLVVLSMVLVVTLTTVARTVEAAVGALNAHTTASVMKAGLARMERAGQLRSLLTYQVMVLV
jgi:hypothetical protein